MVTSRSKQPRGTRRREHEPRDRGATRERLLAAVGRLIAREGFSALGVNAVSREAGVDKVLIYRYFGGIEPLLDAWGQTVLVEPPGASGAAEGSIADRAAAALVAFGRAARRNPEALEVMRWELVEDNLLTRRLAQARESAGLADLRRIGISEAQAGVVDLPALAAVLSAGLLHIALRARTAPRWLGIPIRTEAGWARLERSAAALVRCMLAQAGPRRPRAAPRPSALNRSTAPRGASPRR
jgi:AcrR family transcriptional regulator